MSQYEIALHALMSGWLRWLWPRVQRSGELLKIYLLCYVLFRFLVEVVRGLTLYPFAMVLAGIISLFKR